LSRSSCNRINHLAKNYPNKEKQELKDLNGKELKFALAQHPNDAMELTHERIPLDFNRFYTLSPDLTY
jgi:hypothetical protein